jgi:hypothetical protein
MMENPHNITPATHLLFIAKNWSGSVTTQQTSQKWSTLQPQASTSPSAARG